MSSRFIGAALTVFFAGLPLVGADDDPAVLRIGTMSSITEQVPPSRRKVFDDVFHDLVRDLTGFDSINFSGIEVGTAAKQLVAGKWDLGLFQSIEFAWIQDKYPKLQPLVIAKTAVPLRAQLIVGKGTMTAFAELKGKNVYEEANLPCQLFANKEAGVTATKFFGKLWETRKPDDALDDILRGKAQGAIVDTLSAKDYKDFNPGRFARLKVIAESPVFPAAVVVYAEGALSKKTLDIVRAGLFKAHKTDKGNETLKMFHVVQFVAVPADYRKELRKLAQVYPAPSH